MGKIGLVVLLVVKDICGLKIFEKWAWFISLKGVLYIFYILLKSYQQNLVDDDGEMIFFRRCGVKTGELG